MKKFGLLMSSVAFVVSVLCLIHHPIETCVRSPYIPGTSNDNALAWIGAVVSVSYWVVYWLEKPRKTGEESV